MKNIDITNIIEEIQQLNGLDGKTIPERIIKFNEEFGEFNAELGKFIGITHKPYDKPHLVEEMADAMQNLYSIYLAVCEEAEIDFVDVIKEIEKKNKKWREKAPQYTKNRGVKYDVNPYGLLKDCKHFPNRRIGSSWCTNQCKYCSNVELDNDPHGRLDSIKFTCKAR